MRVGKGSVFGVTLAFYPSTYVDRLLIKILKLGNTPGRAITVDSI